MIRSRWFRVLLLGGVFAVATPITTVEAQTSTTPVEDLTLIDETSDASSVTPDNQLAQRERREFRRERREFRRERREFRREFRRERREHRRERREFHREHREHRHGGLPFVPS